MAQRKQALGKGLSALLSAKGENQLREDDLELPLVPVAGGIALVKIDLISTNPWQPRSTFEEEALQGLSDSIAMHGVIQPITIRPAANGRYELISGERRFRASQLAGLFEIPAYIRSADDQGMLEMALIENIHREDLNALEVALSYQRLMDECSLTQEALSERVAKKRSTITNYLRLLKLPAEIQSSIMEGKLSMGHARALAGAKSENWQIQVFNKVISAGLSVRQTEVLVSQEKHENEVSQSPKKVSMNLELLFLTKLNGQKARVQYEGDGLGKISIPFNSQKEFDAIVKLLDNK